MAEQDSKKRISYVKPEALDLGSVAPIGGTKVASCVAGRGVDAGGCITMGNAATETCEMGNGILF